MDPDGGPSESILAAVSAASATCAASYPALAQKLGTQKFA